MSPTHSCTNACPLNPQIGLAVGDIDEIQRSATRQLIAQQVYWLDQVESRFPKRIYDKAQVKSWVIRPPLMFTKRVSKTGKVNSLESVKF